MPVAYEIRTGGDGRNRKQSMAELKLRRLNEVNLRLREDLERPRIRVSEAASRFVSLYDDIAYFLLLTSTSSQPDKLLQHN